MKDIKIPLPINEVLTPWAGSKYKYVIGETMYEQYLLIRNYDKYQWLSLTDLRVSDWNQGEKNIYKSKEATIIWFLTEIRKSKCFASDDQCEVSTRIENYQSVR